MTTRTLISALCMTAALFPASLAGAQPRPVPTPRPAPAPNPVQPQRQAIEAVPLTIGEPVVGGINNQDHAAPDGHRVDYYHVQLTQGQPYHFSVTGQGFSATVEILDAEGGELLGDKIYTDDGLAVLHTADTAVYTIAVGTQNAADSGRYILHAVVGGEDFPQRENQTGDVAVLEGTQPFTGDLNDQSETSAQGRYFSYSVVDLEAGQQYCLYAQSPDDGVFVDAVSLQGHAVEFLAIEQDGAFIRFSPTVSGQYALSTIAKQPNHVTSYTGYAWAASTGSSTTIVDQLSDESVLLDNGCFFDFHEVELVAGTAYAIDVTSDDFDTVAYLFDADDNQLAENDNADDTGTDARIMFTPETTGIYYVGVSSTAASATGGYVARVASGDRIGQDSGVSVTRGDDTVEDAPAIVGRWEIARVQQGDQQQDIPDGAIVYAINADGTTAYYEDGKLADRGTYTLDGDQMTMTDSDGVAETSTIQINGDTLTVQIEAPNGQLVTLTLGRIHDADQEQAPARAQAPLGRWDLTSVAYNGETQEIPAGSIVVTVSADGTIHSQVEDQTDNGTYSVRGDQISIRYESDGVTNTSTFHVQDRTLTIQSDDGNGKPVTMTFNYLGEPGDN